jgi:hypothetical protein
MPPYAGYAFAVTSQVLQACCLLPVLMVAVVLLLLQLQLLVAPATAQQDDLAHVVCPFLVCLCVRGKSLVCYEAALLSALLHHPCATVACWVSMPTKHHLM